LSACGVLPLAVITGTTGSELQQPMAIVYIGGELAALLVVTRQFPCIYEMLEERGRRSSTRLPKSHDGEVNMAPADSSGS